MQGNEYCKLDELDGALTVKKDGESCDLHQGCSGSVVGVRDLGYCSRPTAQCQSLHDWNTWIKSPHRRIAWCMADVTRKWFLE